MTDDKPPCRACATSDPRIAHDEGCPCAPLRTTWIDDTGSIKVDAHAFDAWDLREDVRRYRLEAETATLRATQMEHERDAQREAAEAWERRAKMAERERDGANTLAETADREMAEVIAERDAARAEVERLKAVASVRQSGVVHAYAVRLYRAASGAQELIEANGWRGGDLPETLDAAPPSVVAGAERADDKDGPAAFLCACGARWTGPVGVPSKCLVCGNVLVAERDDDKGGAG